MSKNKLETNQLEAEKRKIEIARANQEELEKEKAALADLADESTVKKSKDEAEDKPMQAVYFKPKSAKANEEAWETIYKDYKALYPDRSLKNGALVFTSMEEAVTFFDKHAKTGLKFLAPEVDQNNKLTGFNLFSCGNGVLYQGSLQEIHGKLEADLAQKPDDQNLKEGLVEIKGRISAEYKATYKEAITPTDEQQQQTKSSLPNPLKTEPIPY